MIKSLINIMNKMKMMIIMPLINENLITHEGRHVK